jgi:hypothetical protein
MLEIVENRKILQKMIIVAKRYPIHQAIALIAQLTVNNRVSGSCQSQIDSELQPESEKIGKSEQKTLCEIEETETEVADVSADTESATVQK